MDQPHLSTRGKDSSSSDDSLSPAPAPLKELIATWSRNADFQEVAEGVAYDSVEFVQRQTIAQTLWMCANELEAAMSALSPPPPTAEDGGDVFALAATLLKPYHGSYRVFIKEVARLRALDGSPQPPSEEEEAVNLKWRDRLITVAIVATALCLFVLVVWSARHDDTEQRREDDCRSRHGEIILTYPANGAPYVTGCRIAQPPSEERK